MHNLASSELESALTPSHIYKRALIVTNNDCSRTSESACSRAVQFGQPKTNYNKTKQGLAIFEKKCLLLIKKLLNQFTNCGQNL